MVKKKTGRVEKLNTEFRKAFSTAIIAAAGFITAFAWRDAINEFFNEVLDLTPVQSSFIVALIITILAVIVIMTVSKLAPSEE